MEAIGAAFARVEGGRKIPLDGARRAVSSEVWGAGFAPVPAPERLEEPGWEDSKMSRGARSRHEWASMSAGVQREVEF